MKEYIKVSIIVCIYNTGRYLRRCLDSVFNQTLREIEVILINDGSTDNSLNIIREYVDKFKEEFGYRLVVINQKNKGISITRQIGVNAAKGEFIAFVDSDDYVDLGRYRKMYECAKKYNVDIVQSKAEGFRCSSYSLCYNSKRLFTGEEILKMYFTNKKFYLAFWLQIQKKSLYETDTFPNCYELIDDIYAIPKLLFRAKTIYFLNEKLYFYNAKSSTSITNSNKSSLLGRYTEAFSHMDACLNFENYLKAHNSINRYKKEFRIFKTAKTIFYIYTSIFTGNIMKCIKYFYTSLLKEKIKIWRI